jgi:hypothetical protein
MLMVPVCPESGLRECAAGRSSGVAPRLRPSGPPALRFRGLRFPPWPLGTAPPWTQPSPLDAALAPGRSPRPWTQPCPGRRSGEAIEISRKKCFEDLSKRFFRE